MQVELKCEQYKNKYQNINRNIDQYITDIN